MKDIHLRPVDPERDFESMAELFSAYTEEQATISSLKEGYEKKDTIFSRVAEDSKEELLGFYWAIRNQVEPGRVFFFMVVKPEERNQGVGRQLYEDLVRAVKEEQGKKIRTSVIDSNLESREFVERRGFYERLHQFEMALNLDTFDDKPYDAIIDKLKNEGFRFTSMAELGNTEEVQRKLYELNDTNSRDIPGWGGEASWTSFEDFQEKVCTSNWYKPAGQMVVIDTATGTWVAMSAITRFEGEDYAYNLHTGVHQDYRGRKLAQAVKVLALRYARDVLGVHSVHIWTELDGFRLILYPYIEGRDGFSVVLTEQQWGDFGAALRQIHTLAAPPSLTQGIRCETYSGKWRDMVKEAYQRIQVETFSDPAAIQLAAFLAVKHEEICDLVLRAEVLAMRLKASPLEFVLCHGDAHAGNILVDSHDHLYIVDWDTLILAPKESDLMYPGGAQGFTGYSAREEERLFYLGYGETPVNPAALAYYRYERVVEDIAIYCDQLLCSSAGGDDREQSLRYLKSNFNQNGTVAAAYAADQSGFFP